MSAPEARWTARPDEDRYRRLLNLIFRERAEESPDKREGETR